MHLTSLAYDEFALWLTEQEEGIELTKIMAPPPILDCTWPPQREDILTLLAAPKAFAIILIQAGAAALCAGQGNEILFKKTLRKYMVRKSQGKSQLSYLEQKGKSKLGARIRLRQSQEFFVEINAILGQIISAYAPEVFFLSCSPKLKGSWYKGMSEVPLQKTDRRWRRIPHHVHLPDEKELIRVHGLLCRAQKLPDNLERGSHRLYEWRDWQRWTLTADPARILAESYQEGGLHAYPELVELHGTPQDPRWHPEGDVWRHTLLVVQEAAQIARREQLSAREQTVLVLAALCHDLGKPATTEEYAGRIRSHGHCQTGAEISRLLLTRMGCPPEMMTEIRALVQEHLVHASFDEPSPKALKRLEERLKPASMDMLLLLIEADLSGRPPLIKGLSERAQRLKQAWLRQREQKRKSPDR